MNKIRFGAERLTYLLVIAVLASLVGIGQLATQAAPQAAAGTPLMGCRSFANAGEVAAQVGGHAEWWSAVSAPNLTPGSKWKYAAPPKQGETLAANGGVLSDDKGDHRDGFMAKEGGASFQCEPNRAVQGWGFLATGFTVSGRFWLEYTSSTTVVPETGQTMNGFDTGLKRFGNPTSTEKDEVLNDKKPHRVQYFERGRMELHGENQPPYNVLFGFAGGSTQGGGQQTPPSPPSGGGGTGNTGTPSMAELQQWLVGPDGKGFNNWTPKGNDRMHLHLSTPVALTVSGSFPNRGVFIYGHDTGGGNYVTAYLEHPGQTTAPETVGDIDWAPSR